MIYSVRQALLYGDIFILSSSLVNKEAMVAAKGGFFVIFYPLGLTVALQKNINKKGQPKKRLTF
ncbi:MAG: hypothetical protein DRH08_03340 [Deltaproteobacteria bacterium]|nr:MAG: hypothetical protein DRH08_03340 [Deltaproteobacteria bacterium]